MILQCFGGPETGHVIEVPDGAWDVRFPRRHGEDTYVVHTVVVTGELYRVALWRYATPFAITWRLVEINKVLKFLCGWNLQTA